MGLRKFLCNITTTNKNHTKKIVNSMWKSMKRNYKPDETIIAFKLNHILSFASCRLNFGITVI